MANIIIKNDERQNQEAWVRRSFGVSKGDAAGREAAEVIAARTREAVDIAKRKGDRKLW